MEVIQRILYKLIKHSPRTITEHNAGAFFDILQPGDIAIDCGANVGNVTTKMAERGAIVYAFEPNPHAYAKLEERFRGNKNIHCINKAVWDHTENVKLFLHQNSSSDPLKWSSGSSIKQEKENISADTYVEVEAIDLSKFIADLKKPVSILKIDIEGAECDILIQLLNNGIAKTIQAILVETHEIKIPSLREPMRRIRERIQQEGLTNINLNWG